MPECNHVITQREHAVNSLSIDLTGTFDLSSHHTTVVDDKVKLTYHTIVDGVAICLTNETRQALAYRKQDMNIVEKCMNTSPIQYLIMRAEQVVCTNGFTADTQAAAMHLPAKRQQFTDLLNAAQTAADEVTIEPLLE